MDYDTASQGYGEAKRLRISLLVQGAPHSTCAPLNALNFARAALAGGHEVGRVFFYKDAVAVANRFASDEQDLRKEWATLATEASFELAVCIAAAARRGIVEDTSLAAGFTIVGLGQLIEAIEESDRLVCF